MIVGAVSTAQCSTAHVPQVNGVISARAEDADKTRYRRPTLSDNFRECLNEIIVHTNKIVQQYLSLVNNYQQVAGSYEDINGYQQ
jgi:hypothetical protein